MVFCFIPDGGMGQIFISADSSEYIGWFQGCWCTGTVKQIQCVIQGENNIQQCNTEQCVTEQYSTICNLYFTGEKNYLPEDKAMSFRAISRLSPSTKANERFKQPTTISAIHHNHTQDIILLCPYRLLISQLQASQVNIKQLKQVNNTWHNFLCPYGI